MRAQVSRAFQLQRTPIHRPSPSVLLQSFGFPLISQAATIASITCGANNICGDWQGNFAYASAVARNDDGTPIDEVAAVIGGNIKAAMERLGINNTQLGNAWGGKRQSVQHWVKGKHAPKAADIPRLCSLLAISASDLFGQPKVALHGGSIESHRQWILDQASRTVPRSRETPRKAPKKSDRRRAG
jgi:transcriptional regulator with XRE-family HTH domain